METGTIQKTVALFKSALEGLHADISLIELENLAIMVHRAMTVQARTFHTPEHIFDLADASNPWLALAALFHDIVYYQVDEGFTPEIYNTLAPYIQDPHGDMILTAPATDDLSFAITCEVFDVEAGQSLAQFRGLNEFLSALVMNKKLTGIVSTTDLLEVTACIEATIPFRGFNDLQQSPGDILAKRLTAINARYTLGMQRDDIIAAVKRAVTFANKDVANFSEKDTGRFLDNTWKLLPETNPSLRLRGVYSIHSYREALQKMEGFLHFLDPDDIFESYKGTPPEGDYQRMVALAYRNVYTAREYLGIKLLAAAILEAMAAVTGGDAPVALFLGDIEGDENCKRVDTLLPEVDIAPSVKVGSTLFGLLAFGRASASSFDMQNSPLSLFIYKHLGTDDVKFYLDRARDMFDGLLEAKDFLDQLPMQMLRPIANVCATMALTRKDAILAYIATRIETVPDEED